MFSNEKWFCWFFPWNQRIVICNILTSFYECIKVNFKRALQYFLEKFREIDRFGKKF